MPSGRRREYARQGRKAYQGPNGWYIAHTMLDGSHVAPVGGGRHSSEGNAWRAWRKATGAGKLRG